ncbi:TonB-linked SusC/RagA family outer membrane protein [Chitinophaga niastensis]|uniref:TonB-linked SusC/RagA family outer membrane protein n=1 Tax=Chitinophaga niastensis TaxID=536980 RepID=A0A2P8HGJ7_CHINA|nr:TonB-dependent receptor [Chitinophaga niastensis]PSL45336.1 TonB-linked SusC/RagA family outer membrane protein [Chitinophaga niastensis]
MQLSTIACTRYNRNRRPTKHARVRKLLTLLFLATGVQVSAARIPDQVVSLSFKNATAKQVFREINKQTGLNILADEALLEKTGKANLVVNNMPVSDALNIYMRNQPLTYTIEGGAIIVKTKTEAQPASTPPPPIEIHGIVTSDKGQPLPGATVTVKGTRQGTVTKVDGSFAINANAGETLEFSMVGFKPWSVKLDGKTTTFKVVLEADVSNLTDIVVVGYGTTKKKDLTGSVSSISSDQMNIGGVTSNAAQAIQGRAAGVQVSQSNAAPGGQTIVRIRGGNSIKSTNEPLYVVDGFPSETGKDINPNDIDDIQILKDASSTAIYGARGANGVVMITTKRGKTGKPSIQYDGYYGTQKIIKEYDKMNGLENMQVTNAKAIEKGQPAYYTAADLASGRNNDWFKLATRPATVQSHSLSVSGGTDDSKVALSANYFKQEGALKNTNFERYSVRLNYDKQFSSRFKVGANVYGSHSFTNFKTYDGNIVPSNVMYGVLTASPALPVYNDDGTYARFKGRDNPLAWLMAPTNERFENKININAYADYLIMDGLNFRVNGGTEYTTTKEGTYLPRDLVDGEKVGGKASINDLAVTRNLVETYFTYKKLFNKIHSINVVAGVSYQSDLSDRHYSQVQRFSTDAFLYHNLDAGTERLSSTSLTIPVKMASAYGRLNYSLKDKYLATFTLRRDGSSRFGSNYRFGNFPSGSLAWRASEEEFIKNLHVFSNLKFRGGYGLTGNDRIGDYIYMALYGPTNVSLGQGSSSYGGTVITRLPNESLRWESTAQMDLGVDMGFLNNRIAATVDYYRKKTNSLIFDLPIGDWNGFSTQTVNAGSIENKGIELSITTENIINHGLTWNTTLNIAYNKQTCLDLGGRPYVITQTANPYGGRGVDFTKLAPGQELSTFYGYEYDGVIKAGEAHPAQPNAKPGDPKYKDISGPNGKPDGIIDANDRTYLGHANPHYIYGISNNFAYKGFELSIFLQGALDYSLYNATALVLESGPGKAALNRWTATNDNTDIPRDGYSTPYGGFVNSRFIENASYLRCKMITLGYNIPIAHTFLKSLRGVKVYGSVQNLFTITKYTGSDPEVNTNLNSSGSNANLSSGLDYTAFPAYRSYTMGLKLNF